MGYAVYKVGERDAGYGVPAICDHPDCNEEIDRGLSHICGGEPATDSRGCNLYFCERHLYYRVVRHYGKMQVMQLCARCGPRRRKPFDPKPDTPEWIRHKLLDESWGPWRKENPDEVVAMTNAICEVLP